MCGEQLLSKGGIHFSAPLSGGNLVDVVEKRHLCVVCNKLVIAFIDNQGTK
jgi:hypothetical protein